MMDIQTIFWDCDGTLANSEMLFLQACRTVFKDYGVVIPDQFISEENFGKNISVFDLLKRSGFDDDTIRAARIKRNEVYAAYLRDRVSFMDGVENTLRFLKGKILMGIVSNAYREHLNITIEKLLLNEYFNFSIAGEDVKKSKPDPESYLLAIEKAGTNPSHCLAIEDNTRGVFAAKNAGIQCFLIPNELMPRDDYRFADKVFRNAHDLLAFLKNELG